MKVILSIKPQFVEKIVTGEKKFEFRKKMFKQEVESVIIYSTKPVGCFVGEFKIKSVLSGDTKLIWSQTCFSAGITKEYFYDYFQDVGTAYALQIDELIVYDTPIDPADIIPNFKAPQSFCYTKDDII